MKQNKVLNFSFFLLPFFFFLTRDQNFLTILSFLTENTKFYSTIFQSFTIKTLEIFLCENWAIFLFLSAKFILCLASLMKLCGHIILVLYFDDYYFGGAFVLSKPLFFKIFCKVFEKIRLLHQSNVQFSLTFGNFFQKIKKKRSKT